MFPSLKAYRCMQSRCCASTALGGPFVIVGRSTLLASIVTSEANHTLARWLLLQGNTGALKGPQEKFRSVLKRSCHVSSGEKKAEGQKRRVGCPVLTLYCPPPTSDFT